MTNLDSFADGWTIYVWLVTGALIVITVIFAIRWAHRNDQFDEDIKYLVFDENDQEKMSSEEFKKSQEVMKAQMKKREDFLLQQSQQRDGHEKR